MVYKLKSLFSVFGASGYRYKFIPYIFGVVLGVEDALPAEGAVFIFLRRAYDRLLRRFKYELLYCGQTDNLSDLSVGELSGKYPALCNANCVAVLYEGDAAVRNKVTEDIICRNFA